MAFIIMAVTIFAWCAFTQETTEKNDIFSTDTDLLSFPADGSNIFNNDDSTISSFIPSSSPASADALLWDPSDSVTTVIPPPASAETQLWDTEDSLSTAIMPESHMTEPENPSLSSLVNEEENIPNDILDLSWKTDPPPEEEENDEDVFQVDPITLVAAGYTGEGESGRQPKLRLPLDPNTAIDVLVDDAYTSDGTPLKPAVCPAHSTKTCCKNRDFRQCVAWFKLTKNCLVTDVFCCEFKARAKPSTRFYCKAIEWVEDESRGRRPGSQEEQQQQDSPPQEVPQEEHSNPLLNWIWGLPGLLNGDAVPAWGF